MLALAFAVPGALPAAAMDAAALWADFEAYCLKSSADIGAVVNRLGAIGPGDVSDRGITADGSIIFRAEDGSAVGEQRFADDVMSPRWADISISQVGQTTIFECDAGVRSSEISADSMQAFLTGLAGFDTSGGQQMKITPDGLGPAYPDGAPGLEMKMTPTTAADSPGKPVIWVSVQDTGTGVLSGRFYLRIIQ